MTISDPIVAQHGPTDSRLCVICRTSKPLTAFRRLHGRWYGRICLACHRTDQRIRAGRPATPRPYRRPILERFLRFTSMRGGDWECWQWFGPRYGSQYGAFGLRADESPKGRAETTYAHLVAYRLFVGPIPPGNDLDHLCRNGGCVNPTHLEPVTRSENVRRARAAKRWEGRNVEY